MLLPAVSVSWLLLALALQLQLCAAHMVMSEPPPINYKTNPHYLESKGDFDYTSPLSPSGSNFPCKGHLKDLNTPQGGSVRDYAPGGEYPLRIAGSAVHGGGSCQASLSCDGGKTWWVIKSWIGNCPNASGGSQEFKFKIPSDWPGGTCIFAWTWFNQIGNREMYMNCAVVTIKGSYSGRIRKKRAMSGPSMFVANVGNGCSVSEGVDVEFPNPGSDVTYGGNAGKRGPPSGTCGGQTFVGGGATGTGGTSPNTGGTTDTGTGSGSGTGAPPGNPGAYDPGAGNTGAYNPGSGNTDAGTGTGAGAGAPGPATGPGMGTTPGTGPYNGGGADNGGTFGGNGNTAPDGNSNGGGSQGCDYWRKQGYICSAAPGEGRRRLAVAKRVLLALCVVVGVGVGMV